jgi:hypothetical protein
VTSFIIAGKEGDLYNFMNNLQRFSGLVTNLHCVKFVRVCPQASFFPVGARGRTLTKSGSNAVWRKKASVRTKPGLGSELQAAWSAVLFRLEQRPARSAVRKTKT